MHVKQGALKKQFDQKLSLKEYKFKNIVCQDKIRQDIYTTKSIIATNKILTNHNEFNFK